MAKVTPLQQAAPKMIPYEGNLGNIGRVRVAVEGLTPLLTHSPASMGMAPDAKKGGRIPEPEVEAEAGVYRMPDGCCAIRGEAFRASALGAAGAWKMKKSSARSRLAHMVVVEEFIPIYRKDGTDITDYIIDRRRAIVQRQGIIRCRPRFNEWRACFTVEYDPALVGDPKLIVDILQDAGSRVGVGDYRPAKNGWFGRYVVISYAILD